MKSYDFNLLQRLIIASMIMSSLFMTSQLSTEITAETIDNEELLISTDKKVIKTGEDVTMFIEPLRFEKVDDAILSLYLKLMGEHYQEGAQIKSIKLPKTTFTDMDGKKYGMYYKIHSVTKDNDPIIVDFPLDSEVDYTVVTSKQLKEQHGEGKAKYRVIYYQDGYSDIQIFLMNLMLNKL